MSESARAVVVSQFEPETVGHGGNHRAYQILHDVQQVVGADNVVVASLPRWRRSHPVGQPPLVRRMRESVQEVARRWGQQAGLEVVGCGGFVNRPDQRAYLGKQVLRLIPWTGWLRRWLNRTGTPAIASDETAAILEAIGDLPDRACINLWACVWSYECYYWFRRC